MKVFIVGASGLVGSNVFQYFKLNNIQVIGSHFSYETAYTVPFDTLHISSKENFDVIDYQPNVIIHCGALTHVDYCEEHEQESYEKTVQSTINLLEIAKKTNSKFVYISTDYVFDGQKGLYEETDKVNPISIYGKHKLEAEKNVVKSELNHLIIRVAKVFGHEEREKNFVARLAKSLEEEGTLTWNAFIDQYTTAIDAWDIAKALYLLLVSNKSGVFHLGYGEYMNAYDITMKIVNHYPNAKSTIGKITKKDFRQAAARPPKGGLANKKFLSLFPHFSFKTIEDYLSERTKKKLLNHQFNSFKFIKETKI